MSVALLVIDDPQFYIDHFDWFKEMPSCTSNPHTQLAHCLTGAFTGLKAIKDGKCLGFVIFENKHPAMYITGVYAKGNLSHFIDVFWAKVKEAGYTTAQANSALAEDMFTVATKMEKIYSVYRRTL